MPSINGNAIRPGFVIEHQKGLWVAVKIQHTQPGKGGAFLQVELKNLQDGRKMNERFRATETVERVRLDEADYQFLFKTGEDVTLMSQETFEQISVSSALVGDPVRFLKEGMLVTVCSHEGDIVSVSLPDKVDFEIVEAEPVVKGQTASASYKPAILENGVRVMVPPHIERGTRIIINTEDGTYVERVRE